MRTPTDHVTHLLAETAPRPNDGDANASPDLGSGSPAATPPSLTVLETDQWTREHGDRLAEHWRALEASAPLPTPPASHPPASLADITARADAAAIAADSIGALYEAHPTLTDHPADPARATYWRDLLSSAEYAAVHRRTTHNLGLAQIGASALALAYAAHAHADEQRQRKRRTPSDPPHHPPDPNSPEAIAAEARRLRSVRTAVRAAAEQIETAEDAAHGLSAAADAATLAPEQLAHVARLAAQSQTLRAILAAAGRYRTRARAMQRERLDAPRGVLTGVQLSGDLGAALAAERCAVAGVIPELELLAHYRLATGRLMTYRFQERTPVANGPIIVSVDESSSMRGERIITAKGLALAMAWIARAQHRPCLLGAFATRLHRVCVAEGSGTTPRASPEALADWCTRQEGGGTTPDGPLAGMPAAAGDLMAGDIARGRVDHIIITDGQMTLSEELAAQYTAWARAHRVRTYLIGLDTELGDLARVASRSWRVEDLALDQNAVETVLSIGSE